MIKQLKKVGNSNAIILDKALIELVGLEENGEVKITVHNGSIIITPANPQAVDPARFEAALDHLVEKRRKVLRKLGMSDSPSFHSLDQILAIHHRMVQEFRGDGGVRDPGLLESAVMMPASRFMGKYLHEDIPAMAAAYLFHICKNHALMDGNKRTALAAAEIFINLNHGQLIATDDELEKLTIGVADGSVNKESATEFFRDHVQLADTNGS